MRALALFLFAATSLLGGACHQGEGDYCQVNADCKGALICNVATSTCQSSQTGGGPDAGPIPDAKPIDANPVDGPPVDAMPPID